jgi:hypothetical protein
MSGPNNDDPMDTVIQINEKGAMEPLLPQDDDEANEEEDYKHFSREIRCKTMLQGLIDILIGTVLTYLIICNNEQMRSSDDVPIFCRMIAELTLRYHSAYMCVFGMFQFAVFPWVPLLTIKRNPDWAISKEWTVWKYNRKRKPIIKS